MKLSKLWALLSIVVSVFALTAFQADLGQAIAFDGDVAEDFYLVGSQVEEPAENACGANHVYVQTGRDAVVIEAENFTRSSGAIGGNDWVANSSFGDLAGNGLAMSAVPNIGNSLGLETTGPFLEYDVEFATPGTYYLYIRGVAESEPRRQLNDSLHFGVNGSPITAEDGLGFTGIRTETFNWKNRANGWIPVQFEITEAGLNTFNLWMREDGLTVDRFIVSMEKDFDIETPEIGPAESACKPNNPPVETAIAWDMVNSTSEGLISFSTDADAFLSPADCFGKKQRGVSSTIPFGVLDDSLTIFPDDTQGVIGESNMEAFFCVVDTINNQNQGVLKATWEFDIAGATDMTLSMDIGAMGNFETTDTFNWSYQVDNGVPFTFLSSRVDLEASNTYIMDDGDAFTYEDPIFIGETMLDNNLQTFTEVISGTGSILTLVIEATVNADDDALAFQNLVIEGTKGDLPPAPTELLITEIMYNPASLEPNWEWVEIYNAGAATVDLSGFVFDDANDVVHTEANIAAGMIAPGSSAVLFNADLLSAEQFSDAWGVVNLIPVTDWGANSLNNGGDTVALWESFEDYDGDNVTQDNVLVAVTYDGAGEWPSDDGFGSIYLTDIVADPALGSSWALSTDGAITPVNNAYVSQFAGGNGGLDIGSPGNLAIVSPEPPMLGLAITEIMYNPASPEPNWEWVEVVNTGNMDMSLEGGVIDDGNPVTMTAANIGPGSIPPGESAILFNADAVTAEEFASVWGNVNAIPVTNWVDMSLDNSGDTVSIWISFEEYLADLADETDETQPFATVTYDDGGEWPADDGFASIYLTDSAADPTLGSSWAISTVGGETPYGTGYESVAGAGNNGQDIGSPGSPN